AVAQGRAGWVVLGADTVVSLDGEIFGKPADWDEARWMLSRLAGRVHEVFTGVCVARGEVLRALIEVSRVKFRTAGAEAIERYMKRIHPLDKAGGYAAQEDHGEMIECIEGSATNVAGLPIERVVSVLASFGIRPRPRGGAKLLSPRPRQ
ncbi:MAG: Maf family protein, partial [Terrimicrobiaceae bacterium]|nr:Maf family protein [Terrimicrobiaceae bacterium]